ncbi:uncharacterized protein LOC116954144 [Petromyzon marinus]|uniref:Uncharacterized protein LOC116954144 n=1 Tax=Petromyzon marinus TaxID=7757 RepID=A0AAJ7XEP3_PETMA|nr:uncharacterized protein LOC116954144 [Petromyzon marinus]
MGRERTNPFRNFFIYNPANDTSTCTIGNCQRVMAGQHAANLERHVRYVHPEEIDLATRRDAQARNDAGPPPGYGEPSGKKPRLAAGGRHAAVDPGAVKKPKCIPVKITAEQIRDACTELVTANGRPFSLMDDTGFRKLVDPLLDGLRGSLAVDADSVRENVSAAAAAARDLVRAELRDALVCLRLDAASRFGRSVLAIGVQLVRDGALALRTLAAREVAGGEDLAAVVVGVLHDYAVDVANVYSVTTGGDATKTLVGRQGSAEGRYDDGEPAGDSGSEAEDAAAESLELTELRLQEMSGGAHSLMRGVRCAAHALQLAVGDALDDAPTARLVSDARRVCRQLATQPVAASLRERNLRAPAVDRPARWHSTYGMLEGLLDLEGFCEREAASVPDLVLSHGAWERLRDLLAALKPARAAAESFRSGQLTIGDFYGAWLKCHLDTASVGSEFSHPLACAMKRREKQLLGNDAVVAAVYMDPRYGVLLTDGESERAQRHLRRAWAAMGPRGGRASFDTPDERSPEDPGAGAAGTYGECDELERLLQAKESDSHRKPGGRPGADDGADDVAAALQALDGEPRLKKDANVLVHWEGWRYSKPELFRLSQVALAVPVAHASVERAVSALDFILSPNRCDLDSQTLDDILMVRLNEVFGR